MIDGERGIQRGSGECGVKTEQDGFSFIPEASRNRRERERKKKKKKKKRLQGNLISSPSC